MRAVNGIRFRAVLDPVHEHAEDLVPVLHGYQPEFVHEDVPYPADAGDLAQADQGRVFPFCRVSSPPSTFSISLHRKALYADDRRGRDGETAATRFDGHDSEQRQRDREVERPGSTD